MRSGATPNGNKRRSEKQHASFNMFFRLLIPPQAVEEAAKRLHMRLLRRHDRQRRLWKMKQNNDFQDFSRKDFVKKTLSKNLKKKGREMI